MKRAGGKKNASGMDAGRLKRLMEVVQEDIDADKYYGAVLAIGRHA